MDYVDEVGKLAALQDKGVLTPEEFDRKKTELLSRGHSAAPAAQADPLGRGSGASLDLAQKLLIEQRVANERPSQAVAYLLWLFSWMLGGHRFYLGRSGSAIAMLVLSITVFGLAISIPWACIDLFLIPGMVRDKTDATRDRLTVRVL
jgi:TM2 domain-containing membrane protein YozV